MKSQGRKKLHNSKKILTIYMYLPSFYSIPYAVMALYARGGWSIAPCVTLTEKHLHGDHLLASWQPECGLLAYDQEDLPWFGVKFISCDSVTLVFHPGPSCESAVTSPESFTIPSLLPWSRLVRPASLAQDFRRPRARPDRCRLHVVLRPGRQQNRAFE